jgi:L,D-transpeptidase YcbB
MRAAPLAVFSIFFLMAAGHSARAQEALAGTADEASSAQSPGPLTGWPEKAAPATTAVHVLPSAGPAAAATVETGSIDPNGPPPPNADIGQAARAMIPVPAPASASLDADPSPATDGPATTAAAAAVPIPPTPEEADQTALAAFYTSRRDEPLWVTKLGYTDKALGVIAELKRAGDWGLEAAEFDVPELGAAKDTASDLARDDLAKAEMTVSFAVLKYARHARGGRIPDPATTLSSYLDRRPQYRDRKELLEDLAKSEKPAEVLIGLHPQQPQFNLLRQAWLETQRAKTLKGSRLATAIELKPGDRHLGVSELRKRMAVPALTPADDQLYDDALASAVKGFQTLKDIAPADGVVTAATRAALAKRITGNADQLAANMQLWRWMPEDLGQIYVNVNVPEYMIHIVKGGTDVFTERVTVGLVDKQTPIFSDQMERVTFKSRWRVPDSIKVHEIWPSLLRGGGLMRQHNLRIKRTADPDGADVDWQRVNWSTADMNDYFVYRPPGGANQLGLVKFSFPSKHYVFMHDTNEKYMFNWSRRANSHGCMRIRNPLQMATVVLGEDKGWDRAKIDDLVKNGPDHNVIELDRKIPVHITYFTVRIGKGGKIETWGDIYGHEQRVTLALANKYDKIAKGRDHLAPLDQTAIPRVASAGPKRQPKSGDSSVQSLMSAILSGL